MYLCLECNHKTTKTICPVCKSCCECVQLTQQELATKTGLKQPHIGGYLKDIDNCEVLRKPIVKILKAQGKWTKFKRMWVELIRKSENSS